MFLQDTSRYNRTCVELKCVACRGAVARVAL